jgi:hypothetical protein
MIEISVRVCTVNQESYWAKSTRVIAILKMKFKIIADFESGKHTIIRDVEANLCCYKEILMEMNKPRIEPTIEFLFQEDEKITAFNFCTLILFSKIFQILNIFLKFTLYIYANKVCIRLVNVIKVV